MAGLAMEGTLNLVHPSRFAWLSAITELSVITELIGLCQDTLCGVSEPGKESVCLQLVGARV